MNRAALIRAAVLALPLVGLGWTWTSADRLSRQGTEWDVPVRGYDPRDLLQGHYLQFQYDWPGLETTPSEIDWRTYGTSLCLEGTAPKVTRAVRLARVAEADRKACANFVDGHEMTGFQPASEGGRLYTSQEEALRLQQKLADPRLQGTVRFRLRPDGHITPLGMTFRPRAQEPAQE